MSHLLWRAYLEDDVEHFKDLLQNVSYTARGQPVRVSLSGSVGVLNTPSGTSPGSFQATSPLLGAKRKDGQVGSASGVTFTRGDINWRDSHGLSILHHAASSVAPNAAVFAQALLDHPGIDLYLQDLESGWTALHRAFYFGNIAIARAILERDATNKFGRNPAGRAHNVMGLIKIKDHEGYGPLDLYAATIQDRTLHPDPTRRQRSQSIGSDHDQAEMPVSGGDNDSRVSITAGILGDECYTFGTNRNLTLGFGDGDDRQWPERITIRRPDHLLHRLYREHLERNSERTSAESTIMESSLSSLLASTDLQGLPFAVKSHPIKIIDIQMSKLHTAVLTDDPESNLHICGHGPGGRLGLGHDKTQFIFTCVEGGGLAGKRIIAVGLGQNHSLAISSEGEIFSWGSNSHGQLGYSLPKASLVDDDPVQNTPRQIFGPLKREVIQGVAASRIHSVAFAGSSLYTWGKNEGQLGLVDSDARSLEVQTIPRKVGASLFSTPISAVSAIDRATVCLLSGSHDCWVFANYGYAKIQFPFDAPGSLLLTRVPRSAAPEMWANHIVKVTAAGDTICAMSGHGEVFSLSIGQPQNASSAAGSTTNPTKIKGALSPPQRIWSLRKNNMAARDIGVDADGSIILTTEEGSVWKRSRRAKIKDSVVAGAADYKPKDYKFSRISGLTRVVGVRASSYGAYAAVRRDCDVTRTQIAIEPKTLWSDLLPLLCFADFGNTALTPDSEADEPEKRFWQPKVSDPVLNLKRALLQAKDTEAEVQGHLLGHQGEHAYDLFITSSVSELRLPMHKTVLAARSRYFRHSMKSVPLEEGPETDILRTNVVDGRLVITFLGVDALTLLNLVLYCYTDNIVDYWHYASRQPKLAHRYRTIRAELMKIAVSLGMRHLEAAVRQMITPNLIADHDFEIAFSSQAFFADADVLIELTDTEVQAHTIILCQRCPFFQGMFMGRAGGRWLEDRRSGDEMTRVDLRHIEKVHFDLVMRHIYADTGAELFDDVVSADIEDFFDFVMEVMSIANELMLDRLAQICQSVMGRYVNVRNVSSLLNVVAPSSVAEFKDAALEYMCLNLEAMLHAGHLDELDEDLLFELDEIVRGNQLAAMPFAKSGRAEAELLERHPELLDVMARNKRVKIDSALLHSRHREVDSIGTSFRAQNIDDVYESTPQNKTRRKSKGKGSAKQSPALFGKDTLAPGLRLDGDIDLELNLGAPAIGVPIITKDPQPTIHPSSIPGDDLWYDSRGKAIASPGSTTIPPPHSSVGVGSPSPRPVTNSRSISGSVPWGLSPMSVKKLDLKDIMLQTTSNRISNLTASLAASSASGGVAGSSGHSAVNFGNKVSQKERRKMSQQQQQLDMPSSSPSQANQLMASGMTPGTPSPKVAPWQVVGSASKVPSLKDVMGLQTPAKPSPPSIPVNVRATSTPQLTMRQTIANTKPIAASPQHRPPVSPLAPRIQSSVPKTTSLTDSRPIRSFRHEPRPVEAIVQLSMADILYQQQEEKDTIIRTKEENSKRSLQDIQAEQEFQAWWDAEERRVRKENGLLTKEEIEQDRQAKLMEEKSKGPVKDRKKTPRSGGSRQSSSRSTTTTSGPKEESGRADEMHKRRHRGENTSSRNRTTESAGRK